MSKLTSTTFPAIAGATSVCASLARLPVASMYAGIGITAACAVEMSTVTVSAAAFVFAALEPPQPAEIAAKKTTQPRIIPKTPSLVMVFPLLGF